MSTVRIFAVENQLARVVEAPGGKTVDEHVRAATARIEGVRDASLASLVQKSEALAALAAEGRAAGSGDALGRIYDLSNAIFGIAGAFDLQPLAEATFSLCDLADGFRSGGSANWAAIDVHVDGIRLLAILGDRAGEAGAASILEGLRRVRQRVLPASG
ncbi:hypothetical protein [Phenylobacterium sp. SCN 70-31]|uniref:hypothetical protein n=1 Tax=Phenylobacterium sp. SCN 70-31 TaxID=1660129 RepID=UPI00086D2EC7|nr:hypothetical protein [Phenylobacterium sp. SCN 70-31]ODT88431.1 MAG: hypothetical protein ABS78_07410 [Phenylobacterium sp. SCN 70-31]